MPRKINKPLDEMLVKELRAELVRRYLPATGLKPQLFERLRLAREEERLQQQARKAEEEQQRQQEQEQENEQEEEEENAGEEVCFGCLLLFVCLFVCFFSFHGFKGRYFRSQG